MPDYNFDKDFFFAQINKEGFLRNAHQERLYLPSELLLLKTAIEKTLVYYAINDITDKSIMTEFKALMQKKADEEYYRKFQLRQIEFQSKESEKIQKSKGDLYLILDSSVDALKIGRSKNVNSRFSSLQTSTSHSLKLLYTIVGCANLEKQTHSKFDHLRLRSNGEWFTYDKSIVEYFKELQSQAA